MYVHEFLTDELGFAVGSQSNNYVSSDKIFWVTAKARDNRLRLMLRAPPLRVRHVEVIVADPLSASNQEALLEALSQLGYAPATALRRLRNLATISSL